MKKIFGLAIGLLLTAFTFGQTVTFNDAGPNYNKASVTEFNFSLDATFTDQKITDASTYYTDYFTITPQATANGHDISIKLVEDTEMNRRIITRFFMTLGAPNITVGGNSLAIDDFMQTYIMN